MHEPLVIRIEEGLFLGNATAAAEPKFLEQRVGSDNRNLSIAVLNTSEDRRSRPSLLARTIGIRTRFLYRQIPFTDLSHNPMEGKKIWEAVKWMHEMSRHRPILVHCRAGIGRSASVIAAYLRLIRHPNKTYDEIIDLLDHVVSKQGHQVFLHINLPEILSGFLDDEYCRQELARMIGKEHYVAVEEPSGEVLSVSFIKDKESDQTKTVRKDEVITVLAKVEAQGAEPRGVILHANLGGDVQEIPMFLKRAGLYQAEVVPKNAGDGFWLRISASIRRHDHPNKRKWASTDLHIIVVKQ